MKPGGFSIMVGIAPHGSNGDEDNLNREGKGNSDDLAGEVVCAIIHSLAKGGPSAVRRCRAFCASLEEMCETALHKDKYAHEGAANEAAENLDYLIKSKG